MCKTCPKCETPGAEFGPNAARADGLQVYCRACMKVLRLARAYDKARWHGKREQESQRNREYRQANAERLKQQRELTRPAYNLRNAARIRKSNIARKHGERRATPAWADLQAMSAVYAEAKRLEALDGIPRHVDHDVPLKSPLVCGLHVSANLQILTATENMAKHNKFAEAW